MHHGRIVYAIGKMCKHRAKRYITRVRTCTRKKQSKYRHSYRSAIAPYITTLLHHFSPTVADPTLESSREPPRPHFRPVPSTTPCQNAPRCIEGVFMAANTMPFSVWPQSAPFFHNILSKIVKIVFTKLYRIKFRCTFIY